MFVLILAMAGAALPQAVSQDPPAAQAEVVASLQSEPPTQARAGDLTVDQGGMMAWMSSDGLGGQVSVVVENGGTEPDRLISVTTPSGTVGELATFPIHNGRGERAPDGDMTIAPGRTGVLALLADLTSGRPAPVQTTITLVFERAGEITVSAHPVSPAPPPPPPPPTRR
jgi:Uncharacterized protein conserved in bacteria